MGAKKSSKGENMILNYQNLKKQQEFALVDDKTNIMI